MSDSSLQHDDKQHLRHDPLQPPFCINCGYSLVGLQPECICPECAHPHKASDITIKGWPIGSITNLYNLRLKSKASIFVMLTAPITFLILTVVVITGEIDYLPFLFVPILFSVVDIMLLFRGNSPPLSAILSNDGILQRHRLYPKNEPLVLWHKKYIFQSYMLKDRFFVLHIRLKCEKYLPVTEKGLNPIAIMFQANDQTISALNTLIQSKLPNDPQLAKLFAPKDK